ncbi:MAG: hypothetical protein M0T74_00320 [Desulfitobacterium hafniense]|nr:hypothetical protein [Desulfitobacterium hafniense]
MERKKLIRTVISLGLLAALVLVIYLSQNHDPTNPHSTVSKEKWINGPNGHGYAVLNNQQPWKQCYPCHEKKGYGGESYCLSCHEKSGVKVSLPKQQK